MSSSRQVETVGPTSSPSAVPEVCLVSHSYTDEGYRTKLSALSREVKLVLVTPARYPGSHGEGSIEPRRGEYEVRAFRCLFPLLIRSSTRWVLASRDFGFRASTPDIIHVENEAHSFSLIQTLLFRRLYAPRARIVVFVWANAPLAGLKGHVLDFVSRLIQPAIDRYIAGSAGAEAILRQRGIPPEHVSVMPQTGVETRSFRPPSSQIRNARRSALAIDEDEFVVGYVGRFTKEKGIYDLLDAIHRLGAGTSGPKVRLLCVGAGPLAAELRAMSPRVLVASERESNAVRPYYEAMDVLVLPSRTTRTWREQFGRVLIEAMASAVPVIGASSGAIPEVIGDAGLVFPEGSVAILTDSLMDLWRSPQARATLAQKGLLRVARLYSTERIVERTVAIYREMTAGSQTGAESNTSDPFMKPKFRKRLKLLPRRSDRGG